MENSNDGKAFSKKSKFCYLGYKFDKMGNDATTTLFLFLSIFIYKFDFLVGFYNPWNIGGWRPIWAW